ncbi:MAG: hypothetical protein FJX23_06715 [Alphaproteobacteria bacterium]|nr:hypothetical protein [Alphaproteobacteria bacterium]
MPRKQLNQARVPEKLSDMLPADRDLFRAITSRDEAALEQAIADGADINAYHLDDNASAFSGSGKLPIHLAATCGFKKGVEMLVHLGVDVDATDMNPRTENAPLHVSTSHRDQFMSLLSLGADINMPNGLGFSTRQVVARMDNKLELQPKPPFKIIIKVFESVPYREDLSGLTVKDLFARDDKGLSLMDNPKMLRRMDEVMAEVAKNDRPLTMADLQQTIPPEASYLTPARLPETLKKLAIGVTPSRIGEVMKAETDTTYLDRIADVGALAKCVAGLNKQGEQCNSRSELVVDGAPAGLLKLAMEKHQLQALFTPDNWKGEKHSQLAAVYNAVPQGSRWQIGNFNSLYQQIRSESPDRSGVGR